MSFARKKAYFPIKLTYLNGIFVFSLVCKSQIFLRIYFDLSLALCFSLPFFFISGFVALFISSFFCMELWLDNILGKGKN